MIEVISRESLMDMVEMLVMAAPHFFMPNNNTTTKNICGEVYLKSNTISEVGNY